MVDGTVEKLRHDNEKIEELKAELEEEKVTVSPHWKEFHVEDAIVYSNYYGVRIVFMDYPPETFFSGSPGHFVNRKVDVLMSKESFLEFASYIANIAESMEDEEEIEELKELENKEE